MTTLTRSVKTPQRSSAQITAGLRTTIPPLFTYEWVKDNATIKELHTNPDGSIYVIMDIPPMLQHIMHDSANVGNRNICKSHVETLQADIKANGWKVTGEPFRIYTDGRLADGHHRIEAMLPLKRTIENQLVIFRFPEESMKVVDTGKSRSTADYLKMRGLCLSNPSGYAACLKKVMGVDRAIQLGHNIGAAVDGNPYSTLITNQEIETFYLANRDAIDRAVRKQYTIKGKVPIISPANASMVYFNLEKVAGEPEASAIWGEFVDDTQRGTNQGLPNNHPMKVCRNWIYKISNDAARSSSRISNSPVVSQIFKCLNAQLAGQAIQSIRKTGTFVMIRRP